MTSWISTGDGLPPIGEYVLTWMPTRPWLDDSKTVFAKVQCRTEIRGEVCPNNRGVPWDWREFGPGAAFAHEVTHWAKIEPARRGPTPTEKGARFVNCEALVTPRKLREGQELADDMGLGQERP